MGLEWVCVCVCGGGGHVHSSLELQMMCMGDYEIKPLFGCSMPPFLVVIERLQVHLFPLPNRLYQITKVVLKSRVKFP